MQIKRDFAGSTDMWPTSAGGQLIEVANLTGFTVYIYVQYLKKMALVGAGIKMFDISDISAYLIFMKWNLFISYMFFSVLLHECRERTLLLSGGLLKHPCSRSSNDLPFAIY
jgi:hypothetical protein